MDSNLSQQLLVCQNGAADVPLGHLLAELCHGPRKNLKGDATPRVRGHEGQRGASCASICCPYGVQGCGQGRVRRRQHAVLDYGALDLLNQRAAAALLQRGEVHDANKPV